MSTGWAWICETASTKIGFEIGRVRAIAIVITIKVPIAWITAIARVSKCTPAKIQFKYCSISAITVLVTIEIAFAITDISYTITTRGGGVFLIEVLYPRAVVF